MKSLAIIIPVILIIFSSCTGVTVPPSSKAEDFNLKQAKAIISSQHKVRKKQLKMERKRRNHEMHDLKALSRSK